MANIFQKYLFQRKLCTRREFSNKALKINLLLTNLRRLKLNNVEIKLTVFSFKRF